MTEMAADWPHACIQISPNRGRDVGPFMRLLEGGRFDGLDCVCKIHGKRSLRRQGTFLGDTWRQYAIETLLPDPESIVRVGRCFTANPRLGILGPALLRLPRHDLALVIDRDRPMLRKLMLSHFDRDVTEKIVFFAGTMFWFRPDALSLLRHPPAGGWAFPAEPAPDEGSLAHALERLLPTSALLAGYSVESLPDDEEPARWEAVRLK
jgi:lipopolysaccharide biosynthesis protein